VITAVTRDASFFGFVVSIHYLVLLSLAFAAPALGASIRRSMDLHPGFAPSLATPLPARCYAAALHGVVVQWVAIAAVLSVTLALPVLWAYTQVDAYMGPWSMYGAVRRSLLHLYLWLTGGHALRGMQGPAALPAGLLFALGACACYTAGIFHRVTSLVVLAARAPDVNVRGGLRTMALMALTVVGLPLRCALVHAAAGKTVAGLALLGVVELALAAWRWRAALRLWDGLEAGGLADAARAEGADGWGSGEA
jgi:hypothetical protein